MSTTTTTVARPRRAKSSARAKATQLPLLRADLVAWRAWLRTNHAREVNVWLAFCKGGAKAQVLCYDDALDEALCWGWIDTMVRRVDEVTYARKFTRRVNASKWSAPNLERLRRLVGTPRMRQPGLAMISAETLALVRSDSPIVAKPRSTAIPAELTAALAGSPKARKAFDALPPSHRREYCQWVGEAKRPPTRVRRAAEAIDRLLRGIGISTK
jgi:uncharacterized protein YdeI (YjbR/CyaY-like superfamily)